MRVFPDTNVLVSAFATRGLCADVLRHVLTDHELLVGEVVLKELKRALRVRIKLPAEIIDGVEQLLREHEVVPRPRKAPAIEIRDPSDLWILASAIQGRADVLVTGDRDLLDLGDRSPVTILTPRGFWSLIREG